MTAFPHADDSALEGGAERRAKLTQQVKEATGIDRAMIENLVRSFYARVLDEPILGPIFAAEIHDWEAHLRKMFAFWASVTLMTGDYHGRPLPAHLRLPVGGVHFDRWLALFAATAHELCPPAAAELFVEKALKIAHSLELGMAVGRSAMLKPGERLPVPPASSAAGG